MWTLLISLFRTMPLVLILAFAAGPAAAQLKTYKISDVIYALVGPLGNRTAGNLGNNATFGVIVTGEGVVLIDAGATYKGADKIAAAIAEITDQPVRIVVNSGGQDHRWRGNSYWAERGVQIIASTAAVVDQKNRQSLQFTGLDQLVGAFGLTGTTARFADQLFANRLDLTLGGIAIELHHIAGAHTPGDSFVHVPSESTVFTGDIVYTERLLGITPVSDSIGWIASFEAIDALSPDHIIPGHGKPTDLLDASAATYDYLLHLRQVMAAHIDAGGDIIASVKVDQSSFAHLMNFDELAGRNAQALFEAMEWD
jgi:glyoxylase-like metal-dependent hydrolase (beta-lactamase superfamily II)